jgi:transposase
VYGALDYASGQIIARIDRQKNGDGFATFLEQVAQAWPTGQLVLVMDNVSYHRSQAMKDWWKAQAGRVTPLWLPLYSPNLNLIERVWRYLKAKLACHRFWANVQELQTAAATLLDHLEAHFHTATSPGIYLRRNLCESA